MKIDTSHPSPNHGPRVGADISMLVLHATVGSYASALSWLCNPASKASTHYLISKTGYIYQLVMDDRAAWHAGAAQWFDLDSGDIQRQSIGVELENRNDGHDPYPPAQFASAAELCRSLIARYAIVPDMVTRHLDIAIPHGRKTDPAGFRWAAFKAALFPPPIHRYRVRGLPVYEQSDRDGPLWGHLKNDEIIEIDDPANGHLKDHRGFIRFDPDTLEAV